MTAPTSADLLRRAAAQMRERAQGATAGRWIELGVLDADRGERWNAVGTERDIEVEVARLEYSPDGSCNTAHIASWHPAVALTVADLLDAVALVADHYPPIEVRPNSVANYALAVARAYLGEES